MKVGSLFSGGGLGDFGFMAAGMDIRWQVEIDEYCQKILALRYPESKKYRDIKTLKGAQLEPVDIITGGFPCQPFSVAGRQMGINDDRNLWPEMRRVISETNPSWIVCENVPGIIPIYLETIYSDLEALGYECVAFTFSAHALGANHKRDRLWIICHAKHLGFLAPEIASSIEERVYGIKKGKEKACQPKRSSKQSQVMADTGLFCKGTKKFAEDREPRTCSESIGRSTPFREYWQSEPSVGRVANGIADRVHRLKMLGNGQVPACTYVIGKMIMEIENT